MAAQVRTRGLMEKVKEGAARSQVRLITDNLVKAYDSGSLKGKDALLNFMMWLAIWSSQRSTGVGMVPLNECSR